MKDKFTIISDDLNHGIITELEARKQLLILLGVSGSCEHELVDARNKIIESGYICIKCGAAFKAHDHLH